MDTALTELTNSLTSASSDAIGYIPVVMGIAAGVFAATWAGKKAFGLAKGFLSKA